METIDIEIDVQMTGRDFDWIRAARPDKKKKEETLTPEEEIALAEMNEPADLIGDDALL